ncbi:MAG: hypothetical protein WDZ85_03860 [Candidatus Paceibacterota bacterium]
MKLLYLELAGFKSFAKKTRFSFESQVTAVVGPNGSGKSNVAEAFRWVLGEQSLKSLRGKRGEDLIFNGGATSGRMNRAEVSICFDNAGREFDLDYDQVVITRRVYRDGTGEYELNGSTVRLKDIIELLSQVSLGSTGHHIISQGEADRILNADLRGRREEIEEALGLKIYHWKITESNRKLERTVENKKQVESLRREIAPHLKFLKKQVERIAKADAMRRELKQLYLHYFHLEEKRLKQVRSELEESRLGPAAELTDLTGRLESLSAGRESNEQLAELSRQAVEWEKEKQTQQTIANDLLHQIGRLEGIIEVRAGLIETKTTPETAVDLAEVRDLNRELTTELSTIETENNPDNLKQIIRRLAERLSELISRHSRNNEGDSPADNELAVARENRERLADQLQTVQEAERQATDALLKIKQDINREKEKTIGAERELYELKTRHNELTGTLNLITAKLEQLKHEEEDFQRELAEAAVLIDREVLDYARLVPAEETKADVTTLTEERRQIERLKIRLEDMGGEGGDVLKEYEETAKRDEVLASELIDLEQAAVGLKQVTAELEERLSAEFTSGLARINVEFEKFFSLMFNGGQARLQIVTASRRRRRNQLLDGLADEIPEAEEEEGIDISVNLPRKKIKGLTMLSGGERALTSIALLFAMSQVNPPPFLILDETDAALDEANSRKYGEMITNLSEQSQLILITHNRETMSRAGILYGVTMGADSASRLLSIKFDEAENYAK